MLHDGWDRRASEFSAEYISRLEEFATTARQHGLDPHNQWVGGYVEYEWKRLPAILAAYHLDIRGKRVLEFGSNVGASAVVLARLGAQVQGVDIQQGLVTVARANARLHGVDVLFHHTQEGNLPFQSSSFDIILCNSVLEYVDANALSTSAQELSRLLTPGGHVLITGTSNRLWPREVHSRRWLLHWLPESVHHWLDCDAVERGVNPFSILRSFGTQYDTVDVEDRGRAWLAARATISQRAIAPFYYRVLAAVGRTLRIAPGCLAPNVSMLLRKRAN